MAAKTEATKTTSISLAQAIKRIEAACRQGGLESGLYCQIPLIPIGGEEIKVKPPTYATADPKVAKYPYEQRYVNGDTIPSVYLAQVQDEANRMEMALLNRMRNEGDIRVPNVEIECPFLGGKLISIFELPHRFSDFHLKDSLMQTASFKFNPSEKDQAFRNTTYGRRIYGTFGEDFNEEILRFSPVSVTLGGWNSFGDKANKEFHNKLHRCVQSETVAIVVGKGIHTHSRIDPIIKGGEVQFKGSKKKEKMSSVGGGYFPPTIVDGPPGGVCVTRTVQNWSLQFQALLRYSTAKYRHGQNGEYTKRREQDAIAREMLAWLSIAMHMFRSNDYFYRSGCALQRTNDTNTYTFSKDNVGFTLTEAEAITQYNKAAEKLEKVGRYDRGFHILMKLDPTINQMAFEQMFEQTKNDKKKIEAAENADSK